MKKSGFDKSTLRPRRGRRGRGALVVGLVFIAAGLMVVGRNAGIVDGYVYNIVMSWPMLVVIAGLMLVSRRDVLGGLVVAAAGAFFLIPRITGAGPGWFADYKPVLLILIGVLIVAKVLMPHRPKRRGRHYDYSEPTRSATGFVEANNVLGSYENIVLDEIFTGADISGVLGGTVLDLRHTAIPEGDTFIDINSTLAGVTLYVPAEWEVVPEIRTVVGGIEDKRYGHHVEKLHDRRLVLRGNITLGGVEIKN
ncbi:MAG: cell wall-active antibiotics response protein [Alistipes sp.]|nr:cell wall-active antibiotics response protein [Alistipes sp.]